MIGDSLPPPPVIAAGENPIRNDDPRTKDILEWAQEFFRSFDLQLKEIHFSQAVNGTIILRAVLHEDGQPDQKYTCWRNIDGAFEHRITV